MNVFGDRFQSIQTPKMSVFFKKQLINETYCTIVNNTLMHCPTPSVKEFTRNFRLINGLSSNLASTFENQIDDLDVITNNGQGQKTAVDEENNNQINILRSEPKRTQLKLKINFGLDNLRSLPLIGESFSSALIEQQQKSKLDSKDTFQATSSKAFSSSLDQDDQQDEEDRERSFFTINYVSDPKVYKLDQTASSFNDHSLIISGENLNYAISANELNVTIGNAPCTLESLTENQLICSAIIDRNSLKHKFFKADKLPSIDRNSNLLSSFLSIRQSDYEQQPINKQQLPVIVRFSENLQFHLGFLTNDDTKHFKKLNKKDDGQDDFDVSGSDNEEGFFSRGSGSGEQSERITQNVFIKGVVISGILLIIFCLIVLISFKRKSNEVEKEYKRMQLMMMDTLENNVRLECKQAFAELQTDLTEVNNLNQDCNIALLPSINYISNIFFPGLGCNPLSPDYKVCVLFTFDTFLKRNKLTIFHYFSLQLHNGQVFYNNSTNGQLLEELLFSKHFLLTFIDVLEQQPSFTLRDRCVFKKKLFLFFQSNFLKFYFYTHTIIYPIELT